MRKTALRRVEEHMTWTTKPRQLIRITFDSEHVSGAAKEFQDSGVMLKPEAISKLCWETQVKCRDINLQSVMTLTCGVGWGVGLGQLPSLLNHLHREEAEKG